MTNEGHGPSSQEIGLMDSSAVIKIIFIFIFFYFRKNKGNGYHITSSLRFFVFSIPFGKFFINFLSLLYVPVSSYLLIDLLPFFF
jgi:hypothetical protein